MNGNRRNFGNALLIAFAVLALAATGSAQTVRFLDDGALHNNQGTWDLPAQGTCPVDLTQASRPHCLALRFPMYPTDGTGAGQCREVATGGANRSWSTGVCNDLVNNGTQGLCESQPDRKWSNGICAVVMQDDDRNNVTCAKRGGTWVTSGTCTGNWIMPPTTAYTPNLLTGNGAGDQCLRCHNDITQYNGPRVRDTEETLFMGHKNMSRKVGVAPDLGKPWGGPEFHCSNPLYTSEDDCVANAGQWNPTIYPSDDTGNMFNWAAGTINVSGVDRQVAWIYGDWLAALPRAIYKAPASTSQVCSDPRYTTATCVANGGTLLFNAGASYSCARCHTTGWTSDATINAAKEPERSFPGITWDRNSNAGFGVVNLSGGVANDPNKYASWDAFGITCSRCHNSAVDTTTNGGVPPHTAPAGMSSHHNNLTAADGASCTDTRFTREAECTAAGGTWQTPCSVNPTPAVCTNTATTMAACTSSHANAVWVTTPVAFCSNAFYTTQATCTANGNTWQDGYCTRPDLNSTTCTGGSGTWRLNGTQQSCLVAQASWPFSKCSVEGYCNNPMATDVNSKAACDLVGGQFAYATDVIRCEDAGGHWTGNNKQRGQIITALCMNCHRQETAGVPTDATNPAGAIKTGPVHGSVEYSLHFHGNQFLNSPHALFTGTFAQISTGKWNYAGTGEYKSYFLNDAEAIGTGNGCTGCHEVHTSTVTGERPFREECTECHAKNTATMAHPAGTGTPFDVPEPFESCVTCHMPGGQHLFRVSSDASYSAINVASAINGVTNANTSPDGAYTNAVWVDLDAACGQCHGGGTANLKTTGTINAGSPTLTVSSTAGFLVGERIKVTGAGALYYDDDGVSKLNDDFHTYIKAIASPTTLTLAGNATKSVVAAPVEMNPTTAEAAYITKAALAPLAKGIHRDAPKASFTYVLGNPNTLQVTVNAGGSSCSGSSSNCDAFEWNWGDGTPNGSGLTATHTYATAGTRAVVLTVHEYGVNEASVSRKVTTYAVDNPPTAASTCTGDANTWVQTLVDASTDSAGIAQVVVNWGDNSLVQTGFQNGTFTHTYLNAGTFVITHTAIDTTGQASSETCTATFSFFTIGGTVQNASAVPLANALVQARKGGRVAATAYSAANGTFTLKNLKPGTYSVTVTKYGYTFPSTNITVGPSSSGNTIQANP